MFFICAKAVVYTFEKAPVDVVILCIRKDARTLDLCIKGIKKNGKYVRRIIVISPEKLTKLAEWFDEAKFPFSKAAVAQQILKNGTTNFPRLGWIFQQLLKLYAPFVIQGISPNILLLDADTIFLNPVSFYDEDSGAGFFNPGTEYHGLYFDHAGKLVPSFKKIYKQYSGISHHMLIQLPILKDLFLTVETARKKDFWRAFCDCIDLSNVNRPCASEYEIYFNFALGRTKQCKIRELKWANVPFQNLDTYQKLGYHYVSCHRYLDKKRKN
jgi:hypothetical protein